MSSFLVDVAWNAASAAITNSVGEINGQLAVEAGVSGLFFDTK
jgi:hypothetical protein